MGAFFFPFPFSFFHFPSPRSEVLERRYPLLFPHARDESFRSPLVACLPPPKSRQGDFSLLAVPSLQSSDPLAYLCSNPQGWIRPAVYIIIIQRLDQGGSRDNGHFRCTACGRERFGLWNWPRSHVESKHPGHPRQLQRIGPDGNPIPKLTVEEKANKKRKSDVDRYYRKKVGQCYSDKTIPS